MIAEFNRKTNMDFLLLHKKFPTLVPFMRTIRKLWADVKRKFASLATAHLQSGGKSQPLGHCLVRQALASVR